MHEENPFDINPYIELDQRYQSLEKLRKEVEAQTYKFMDDFHKVFIPDQNEFDSLKDQAKQLQLQKASQVQLDPIYYKMAMIYKRWLPIEERLLTQNPDYKKLFSALKYMLQDIEKRNGTKAEKKDEVSNPQRKRRDGSAPQKRNGNKRAV